APAATPASSMNPQSPVTPSAAPVQPAPAGQAPAPTSMPPWEDDIPWGDGAADSQPAWTEPAAQKKSDPGLNQSDEGGVVVLTPPQTAVQETSAWSPPWEEPALQQTAPSGSSAAPMVRTPEVASSTSTGAV